LKTGRNVLRQGRGNRQTAPVAYGDTAGPKALKNKVGLMGGGRKKRGWESKKKSNENRGKEEEPVLRGMGPEPRKIEKTVEGREAVEKGVDVVWGLTQKKKE